MAKAGVTGNGSGITLATIRSHVGLMLEIERTQLSLLLVGYNVRVLLQKDGSSSQCCTHFSSSTAVGHTSETSATTGRFPCNSRKGQQQQVFLALMGVKALTNGQDSNKRTVRRERFGSLVRSDILVDLSTVNR